MKVSTICVNSAVNSTVNSTVTLNPKMSSLWSGMLGASIKNDETL